MFTIKSGWNTGKSESVCIYSDNQFIACVLDKTGKATNKAENIVKALQKYGISKYMDIKAKLPYSVWFDLILSCEINPQWVR